jgi:hypothetical protein
MNKALAMYENNSEMNQERKFNDALCTICKLSDQDENLVQVEWLAMHSAHSANLLTPLCTPER